ncbi:MAG: hypothetical protein IJE43_07495 [Alphaproteobacteria bacterium]|nr:hypothetical protein [Alphaproteobacteria bacterium]
MFSKFKYSPSSYYGGQFNLHVQKGRDLFEEDSKKIRKELKDFILDNGNIDGTSLKEHWFPLISADIFLSHSHKDIEKVKGFAGWLYNEFGLRAFIDSSVWGYCDELLLEIDKKYCFQPKTDTYSYEKRNHTTSHVHMMLSSALTEMIDRCECAIFFNTPNSINVSNEISKASDVKKEATLSPWIYHELSVLNTIEKKPPNRDFLEHRDSKLFEAQNNLKIEYDVSKFLDSMIILTDEMIAKWGKTNKKYNEALDELYKIACPNKK